MYLRFKAWVIEKNLELEKLGIRTNVISSDYPPDSVMDPIIVIEHETKKYMGEISVWEMGQITFEIIDMKDAERVLFKYGMLEENSDFEEMLSRYFEFLKN